LTIHNFSDFGLATPLIKALEGEGYTTPTPIQAQAIPLVLEGRDLCGIAQTGTGKTAAFALPILNHLAKSKLMPPRKGCLALVLTPTRELAGQIADSFRTYGKHLRLSSAVVYGGMPIGKQERQLASGVDILVATPGRLLDLIDRRALSLADVEILVLDEADQMLDLGFIHALKRIVTLLPKERQTLFFSATMPKTIASLADTFLKNPAKVSVTPVATTAERVEQSVIFVSGGRKQALLNTLLQDEAIERSLVFTRTKHGADRVVKHLAQAGVEAAAIHGNKSQPQRERALAAFKSGSCRVLVATDIAARGIDVEGVSHVINFELPNVPESYVHRIGRTARAGKAGIAISFCNGEERAFLKDIEKLTRQSVPVQALPVGFADVPQPAELPASEKPAQNRGGRNNGRPQAHPHRTHENGPKRDGQRRRGRGGPGGAPGGQNRSAGQKAVGGQRSGR
jgi:ATP-dependent RNA helicase RhlE